MSSGWKNTQIYVQLLLFASHPSPYQIFRFTLTLVLKVSHKIVSLWNSLQNRNEFRWKILHRKEEKPAKWKYWNQCKFTNQYKARNIFKAFTANVKICSQFLLLKYWFTSYEPLLKYDKLVLNIDLILSVLKSNFYTGSVSPLKIF